MLNVDTVLIMVLIFVLECYLSQLLIVESPRELPTFQFYFSLCL